MEGIYMKICWYNLEKYDIYLKKTGNFGTRKDITRVFYYKDGCKYCDNPFLTSKLDSKYCSNSCSMKSDSNPRRGQQRSEHEKQKISQSMKGKIFTVEHKNNIAKAKFGKRNPMYGKTGRKHHRYGEKHTEEIRKTMSENHADFSGENHWNWKGGISCEPYCDVWLDKDFKESILERDGYQCLNPTCLRESKRLCIHHINYNKKDCSPFNLITICNSCNTKANSDREWHEMWYNAIIYNRYNVT